MPWDAITVAQRDRCQIDRIQASILEPGDETAVERAFSARGTVAKARGCYVWLAVQVGALYWPKEPRLETASGQWERTVFEGGDPPGRRFVLVLMAVTREASKHFDR